MRNTIIIVLVYLLLMSPGFYFITQDSSEPPPGVVIPGATGDYAIQGMAASFADITDTGSTNLVNLVITGSSTAQDDFTVKGNLYATSINSDVNLNNKTISNWRANVTCTGSYCGLVETITAGTAVSYGQLLVMSGTDGKAYTGDQDYSGRSEGRVLMACEDIAANGTGTALKYGDITKASWGWAGESRLYIAGTLAAATTLVATGTDTYVRFIGYGDGTTIHFEPDGTVIQN